MTYVPRRELAEFARNVRAVSKLLPKRKSAVMVFLRGDLGSGKTTFVQEIAREYGIQEPVKSPTYTIMKSYVIPSERTSFGQKRRYSKLVHIDLYRLESPGELLALKLDSILEEEGTIVFIEWPERAIDLLPEPDITLYFSVEDAPEDARHIQMRK